MDEPFEKGGSDHQRADGELVDAGGEEGGHDQEANQATPSSQVVLRASAAAVQDGTAFQDAHDASLKGATVQEHFFFLVPTPPWWGNVGEE